MRPNKAYMRESIFLPKTIIHLPSIKTALTFEHTGGDIYLYEEGDTHIKIPRNFLPIHKIREKCELIDKRPKKYKKVTFGSHIKLRPGLQEEAIEALKGKEGTLVTPCGSGKTVMALQEIVNRKVPTLIIVNTEQILYQWKERIKEFLGISETGIIQAQKFDWKHPITLATIQTMAKKKLPEEVKKYFGLIIWDEVDEMSTPVYSKTADKLYGHRLGLTGTPRRRDGNHRIYQYHIGPILYQDETFTRTPKVSFVYSGLTIPPQEYLIYGDMVNYGKLYTLISNSYKRNELVLNIVNKKKKEKRKLLVLGERVKQLKYLTGETIESGLCVGEVDVEERLDTLREKQVIYATRSLSKRALDQKDLDTLVCLTPISDAGGLRQAVGRILRKNSSKNTPEVLIVRDINIPPVENICRKMERTFIEWGFEIANIGKV